MRIKLIDQQDNRCLMHNGVIPELCRKIHW